MKIILVFIFLFVSNVFGNNLIDFTERIQKKELNGIVSISKEKFFRGEGENECAFLTILTSPTSPKKRELNNIQQPTFLTFDENSTNLKKFEPIISQYSNVIEKAIGRSSPLPSIHITSFGMEYEGCFIIFDIEEMSMKFHPRFFQALENLEEKKVISAYEKLLATSPAKYEKMFRESKFSNDDHAIAYFVGSQMEKLITQEVNDTLECISCIVSLGIAFPFLVNYVFLKLTDYVCEQPDITEEECKDLAEASILLGDILIPFEALATIDICNELFQCENSGDDDYYYDDDDDYYYDD